MNRKIRSLLALVMSLLMLLPYAGTAAFAAESTQTEAQTKSYDYPLSYKQEDFTVPATKSAAKKAAKAYSLRSSGTVPASFDLRTVEGALPAVRDQNPYGTCWAFSSIIASETSMISKGLADSSVDLSELNLVYNTYRRVNDPLGNFDGDYNFVNPGKTMMDIGGNGLLSTTTLARWGGVTDESVMKYEQGLFACGYEYPNEYASEMDTAHLQNAYWLNITSEAQAIKSFVMQGNAVGMAYFEDHMSINSATSAYYQNTALSSTNHAVAIVGWDDNYSKDNFSAAKQPSENGAWLIRNSWSDEFADGGYFWLSYQDTSLDNGTAYVFDFESAENYDRNYQYDGSAGHACFAGLERSSLTSANVFTANGTETLKAVGIFNPKNTNISYTIKIYLNPTDSTSPTSGQLMSTKSGSEVYCGYHTVVLDTPVNLSANDKFAVVVTMTDTSGEDLWLAYEDSHDYGWMSSVAAYEAGQSFISYDDGYNWHDFGTMKKGNLRIKAFTDVQGVDAPTQLKAAVADSNITLTWSEAEGAQSYEIYKKGENESDYSLLATVSDTQYTYTPDKAQGLVVLYKLKAVDAQGTSDYSKATAASLPAERYLYGYDMSCMDQYTEFTIQKGETAQLDIAFTNDKVDKVIAFSSEDSSIATVSPTGLVTAVGYGNITITAVSRSGNIDRTLIARVPQTINVTALDQMQSAHNYKENTEQLYVYKKTNADSVSVTFSSDTFTTAGRDYMKIYDAAGNLQGTYSSNQLASKTITVQGDTFKLLFESDRLGGDYGFRATAITYTGGDLDTTLLTQYLNEAKALTQSDYTAASWTVLQRAVTSGEEMFTDPTVTQQDVNDAAAAIRAAIDSLAERTRITEVTVSAPGVQNGVLKIIVPAGESMQSVGAQLSVAVEPENASYSSIEWSSDDFFIQVSDNGYVSAAYDYAAYSTITATVTDDFGDTHTGEIVVAFMHYDTQKVTITPKSVNLVPGDETYTLTAAVTDNDNNPSDIYDLTWTSSDENVATVEGGTVTAVGDGTAIIRATADFGGAYDECTVTVGAAHTHSYTATVVAPTCEERGYTTYTCSCGDSYVSDYVDATGHRWSAAVSDNNGNHVCTCLNTGCAETLTESCGDFAVTDEAIAATCTQAGKTVGSHCSVCGYIISAQSNVPTVAHTPEVRGAIEATCEHVGYTGDTYCTVCETKLSTGEEIAMKAHTEGTAANCHAKAVCSVCGQSYGEFNPNNHDGETEVRNTSAASCTADGYTGDAYCLGCDTKLTTGSAITMLDHTPEVRGTVAATCEHVGYTGDTYCKVCETKLSTGEEIAMKAHTEGTAASCHAKAVCSVCGQSYGEFNPINHDGETELRNATAATCTTDGYTGDTYCLGCDTKLTTGSAITKLDHTPEVRGAVAATCEHVGYTGDTYCKVCETKLAIGSEIAMKAHTEGTAASCHAKAVCSVCGQSYGEINPNNHVSTRLEGKREATYDSEGYTGDTVCNDCGKTVAHGSATAKKACSCMCHKTGFMGFIYKLSLFFWRLFGTNKACACGAVHY